MQYMKALQYTCFRSKEKYHDKVAPAMVAFWEEVILPFWDNYLHNFDKSEFVGDNMCSRGPGSNLQDRILKMDLQAQAHIPQP